MMRINTDPVVDTNLGITSDLFLENCCFKYILLCFDHFNIDYRNSITKLCQAGKLKKFFSNA